MKSVKKIHVHMYLPQSAYLIGNNEVLYKKFRKRALKKSNDAHVEKCRNPIQMIININHEMYDVQVGVVVVYKTFNIIKNSSGEEIGFTIDIYVPTKFDTQVLTVFKIGKAFIENKKELEEALQNKQK